MYVADPTKYFGCELGAQTQFDHKNDRFIVNGSHDASKLQSLLDGFIKRFVLCQECSNPETNLVSKTIKGPRWLIWMRRPTGDQEDAGSNPAEVGNIFLCRLIMKYFLRSFSPADSRRAVVSFRRENVHNTG